ncbi:L-2-hydroxyglutarate oxidase [Halanaeroarchaeum sulfurireducens]|uniref:FAD dependent oxidoreductase n=1 Tax=Halanaeroarchaeum sulfurireducens TaxID=1604004 RepID=A0A0F7PEF6_9EURY|nr:L-2-hydroxyglutarate oxidase [Halanaeroarchaeum sulfurireducens]AKH97678.1 FAD dependent oxidoreductase [Halanaeroarchaeum sulfurireducens]ALG82073.1 FAD dependent oxidoreductase [Halanaeroarchaeum sulfurireducens]
MDHDVLIVGGGVVGLSTGLHLGRRTGLDVAVVEKEHQLASHQSGRNSGVLHPGFNYEPGSLKAEFATDGTRRMKEYCRENDIPLREFGVVVSALDTREERRLSELKEQAEANEAKAEIIDKAELEEREPHARGRAALYAPEAASVDSQQYVYQLARDAQAEGVALYLGTEVERLVDRESGYRLETTHGPLDARFLVNAAGLYADDLAQQVGVGGDYQIVPFRGEYYELVADRRSLVNTMIYPTPDPDLPFLGVHYTRRTDDKVIIGPNAVLAFGREAYDNTDVNLSELSDALQYEGLWKLLSSPKMLRVAGEELHKSYRKQRFTRAAQRLVPSVEADDLVKSYAGIRAQIVRNDGELVKDPLFVESEDAIHVLNAVSPGLTASLPFGDHLAERIETAF